MRSLLALLLWLVTTALLAVGLPALWMQHNIVSVDGYSDLAAGAARNPALQQPMAAELTTQVSDATGRPACRPPCWRPPPTPTPPARYSPASSRPSTG